MIRLAHVVTTSLLFLALYTGTCAQSATDVPGNETTTIAAGGQDTGGDKGDGSGDTDMGGSSSSNDAMADTSMAPNRGGSSGSSMTEAPGNNGCCHLISVPIIMEIILAILAAVIHV